MEFCEIIFDSDLFKEAIELRQNILRDPLGLNLYDEGIDDEHGQLHFGLLEENSLVACLAITPLSDTHVRLRQMAVKEDMQRSGLGSQLISAVEKHLEGIGLKKFELNARIEAIPFYTKLNYEKSGEEFNEVGIPHIKMIKTV